METKLLLIAGLALAISAPLARAQEWGERRECMEDCAGIARTATSSACEQLRHMRHEEREEREQHEYQGERGGGAPPPVADPKVALCAAIENNYNNCLKHQHDGCPAWVIELKANHCF